MLVGTGPQGGEGMASFSPEVQAIFAKQFAVPDELWLDLFFTPSAASQAAGRAFLTRLRTRVENRDPASDAKVAGAQLAAVAAWGAPRDAPYAYLKAIKQRTLVVNGHTDIILPTVNSFILSQYLPDALHRTGERNAGALECAPHPSRTESHVEIGRDGDHRGNVNRAKRVCAGAFFDIRRQRAGKR